MFKLMDAWEWLGWFAILLVVLIASTFVLWAIFSEKHVHAYYLGKNGGADYTLTVDIENAMDGSIPLNGVTFKEAIALVDSLNATLQH